MEFQGCYATAGTTEVDGYCNFCTNRIPGETIWVLRSRDPNRRMVVNMCDQCLGSIFEDWRVATQGSL